MLSSFFPTRRSRLPSLGKVRSNEADSQLISLSLLYQDTTASRHPSLLLDDVQDYPDTFDGGGGWTSSATGVPVELLGYRT